MINRDLIFFKIFRVFASCIKKNYICPPTLFILKPLLFFSILLWLPFILVAQGNYKHGYIVDAKGDTLHGFIDFREWISSPVYINFMTTTEEGRARKIGHAEIASFSGKNASAAGGTQLLFPMKLERKIYNYEKNLLAFCSDVIGDHICLGTK